MVIRRALAHGASGFIPKSADSEVIQRALRTVLHAAASQAQRRCVLNIIED